MVSDWSDAGQADWLEGEGIELVRGSATLSGERQLDVAGRGWRDPTAAPPAAPS